MLDFRLPAACRIISSNIIGMADPENMGISVETAFISSLIAKCTSGLTAAILDFRLPVTCDNHLNSTVGLADPENMGVALAV